MEKYLTFTIFTYLFIRDLFNEVNNSDIVSKGGMTGG
jgi:hypothetical protein